MLNSDHPAAGRGGRARKPAIASLSVQSFSHYENTFTYDLSKFRTKLQPRPDDEDIVIMMMTIIIITVIISTT